MVPVEIYCGQRLVDAMLRAVDQQAKCLKPTGERDRKKSSKFPRVATGPVTLFFAALISSCTFSPSLVANCNDVCCAPRESKKGSCTQIRQQFGLRVLILSCCCCSFSGWQQWPCCARLEIKKNPCVSLTLWFEVYEGPQLLLLPRLSRLTFSSGSPLVCVPAIGIYTLYSTSHPPHHTPHITHSKSHTQHHTPHITHPTSHTQ